MILSQGKILEKLEKHFMREFSVSLTSLSFHVKVFHAVPSSRATPSRTVHFPSCAKQRQQISTSSLLSGLLLTYFDFSHSVLKRSSIGLNTAKNVCRKPAQLQASQREKSLLCVKKFPTKSHRKKSRKRRKKFSS